MGPLALPSESREIGTIEQALNNHGIAVQWNHPRCGESDLFGLYLRLERQVVVCPRGNQRETLMHEGWHAIQSLCLRGTTYLPAEDLLLRLSHNDRRELQVFYQPQQWQREGEARLMATLSLERYLISLEDACKSMIYKHPVSPELPSP